MTGQDHPRTGSGKEGASGITRRDLFRGIFFDASKVDPVAEHGPATQPMPGVPTRHARAFPVHRPPGAVAEEDFLAGCTRCNACIDACPHDAIQHAPLHLRSAAGTPIIDPYHAPCHMCADFPCITACEPGVLLPQNPRTMGTAKIQAFACLAYQGSFCSVCSEQCPVPSAIEVKQGRPVVVEALCTGCGVCQHVCPAPENAVLLLPIETRPAKPLDTEEAPEDR